MSEIKKTGVKETAGKPRVDLIPPRVILDIAEVFRRGAEKYEDRNWEKGIEYSKLYQAAMRHMLRFWDGEDINLDDFGLHHIDHALCILTMLKEMTRIHPEMDDRPNARKSGLLFALGPLVDSLEIGIEPTSQVIRSCDCDDKVVK